MSLVCFYLSKKPIGSMSMNDKAEIPKGNFVREAETAYSFGAKTVLMVFEPPSKTVCL